MTPHRLVGYQSPPGETSNQREEMVLAGTSRVHLFPACQHVFCSLADRSRVSSALFLLAGGQARVSEAVRER